MSWLWGTPTPSEPLAEEQSSPSRPPAVAAADADAELDRGRAVLIDLLGADRDLTAGERHALRLTLLAMTVGELRSVVLAAGEEHFTEISGPPQQQVLDGSAVRHPEQGLADDVAAGLAQLGWVIRRHPWLAPELRWELSGLSPRMLLAAAARDQVQQTAVEVGARVGPARFASAEVISTVCDFGQGAVRLVLSTPRPAPQPGAPTARPRPTSHPSTRP